MLIAIFRLQKQVGGDCEAINSTTAIFFHGLVFIALVRWFEAAVIPAFAFVALTGCVSRNWMRVPA
jgi:hypothetical protein